MRFRSTTNAAMEVMRGRDVLFREPIIEKAQFIKSRLYSDKAGCDRSSAR
jgi:hypothetical protein